jgi:hypothetical protein
MGFDCQRNRFTDGGEHKMNTLIDRYIYNVVKRLPENTREEVKKELRANIEDMLPEKANDEEIKKVLITLGDPRLLATQYRGKQRFLISPEWMDDYLSVLKVVMIVYCSIALVFGLIDGIQENLDTNVFGAITSIASYAISDLITHAFQAFGIVTLVFVGIETYNGKNKKKPWDPATLPDVPKENSVKISRSGSIVGLIASAIFVAIFIYLIMTNQFVIAWTSNGQTWRTSSPLFDAGVAASFIPVFCLSIGLSILEGIVKIYHGHWNLPVVIVHTIGQIVSVLAFVFFVSQSGLFNLDFFTEITDVIGGDPVNMMTKIQQVLIGVSSFVGFVTAIDIIFSWIKTLKAGNIAA